MLLVDYLHKPHSRPYEGSIPVFIHGDNSQPHLAVEVSGSGRFPRLTFDVPEVVLPPVGTRDGRAASIASASMPVPGKLSLESLRAGSQLLATPTLHCGCAACHPTRMHCKPRHRQLAHVSSLTHVPYPWMLHRCRWACAVTRGLRS